jgi:hypothetical protein
VCLLSIVAHASAFLLLWPQVHWISSTSFDDGVLLELIELDHLITKKKLEEVQPNKSCPFFSLILFCVTQGEDIKDFINPNSRKSSFATGEPAMRNLQHGTIIQLERKGFFRIDKAFVRAGQVFIPWRSTRLRCALGSDSADYFGCRPCSSSLFPRASRREEKSQIVLQPRTS